MITVDVTNPVPPFEQIRQQLHDQIVDGTLAAGTRLPAIRQLAADLRLAPGTVARAYAELEAARLVETNRSKGTRVRATEGTDEAVRAAADRYVEVAKANNLDLAAALALVRVRFVSDAGGNPAGQPMTSEESLAMRGARSIAQARGDIAPAG
jgi:DNA-binding transcriptional regulator YhcF (GntR family)